VQAWSYRVPREQAAIMVKAISSNPLRYSLQKYHPDHILAFIMCLNRTPSRIGDSLSYALHCAEKARVTDFTTVIQPCAESEGHGYLADCADRCNLVQTHTSATIRIAGKNVCVRDGGKWKDCKDVVAIGGGNVAFGLERLIEKEWRKLNSKKVCTHIKLTDI
jgi:hypothetical protein